MIVGVVTCRSYVFYGIRCFPVGMTHCWCKLSNFISPAPSITFLLTSFCMGTPPRMVDHCNVFGALKHYWKCQEQWLQRRCQLFTSICYCSRTLQFKGLSTKDQLYPLSWVQFWRADKSSFHISTKTKQNQSTIPEIQDIFLKDMFRVYDAVSRLEWCTWV